MILPQAQTFAYLSIGVDALKNLRMVDSHQSQNPSTKYSYYIFRRIHLATLSEIR